jgi:hypothetical protein
MARDELNYVLSFYVGEWSVVVVSDPHSAAAFFFNWSLLKVQVVRQCEVRYRVLQIDASTC